MGLHKSKLKQKEIAKIVNSTEFSETEIQTWYKAFLKEFPSGILTLPDFIKLSAQLFDTESCSDYAERAFRSFDTNHNGSIDFREYMCGLSVTSRGSFEQKLRWAFRMYDTDNDGFVSREEVHKMIKAIYNMAGEDLMQQVMPNSLTHSEQADLIFDRMDKDKDEFITAEEFELAARQDPRLIMLLQIGGEAKRSSFSIS